MQERFQRLALSCHYKVHNHETSGIDFFLSFLYDYYPIDYSHSNIIYIMDIVYCDHYINNENKIMGI